MKLTILGYNSAIPTGKSYPTSQVLNIAERHFLIDCGEGSQSQMRRAKISFAKINHVFISHLHGDHVFGLVGLIGTFSLLGRKKPLYIFGPKGIQDFIQNQLMHTQFHGNYDLIFHELSSSESKLIYEDEKVTVETIPLDHRIYTNGYLFKEKPKSRKLNISAIKRYPEIEVCDYENLKMGKDFVQENGNTVANEVLTFDPELPQSYAFCSDTRYLPSIIPIIKNVDLLYHEATFLHELKETAIRTGHSTAMEAGMIAKEAQVGKMIIGHFSNRYQDFTLLLDEAKTIFYNTVLAESLKEFFADQEHLAVEESVK